MTGIEMTHVPYKGSAPALTDVIAGHVPLLFSDTVPSLPQIREGKVRALGVSTAVRAAVGARDPADRRSRRSRLRRRRLGRVLGAGRHAEGGRRASSMPRSTASLALPDVQQQIIKLGMIPGGSLLARGAAALHRRRDRALGQGRAAGRAGGDGVAPAGAAPSSPGERDMSGSVPSGKRPDAQTPDVPSALWVRLRSCARSCAIDN